MGSVAGEKTGALYYGDNLDVLRLHVEAESVDLVYLDPPFNSQATYNVLFTERSGQQAAAQIRAFEDTWRWDEAAARAYQETVETGGRVADVMRAFHTALPERSDMLAYLSMMAPRLVELRRVLKRTGSLYLHCDPSASHYLKVLLDAAFGPENFRNEIVWKRTSGRKGVSQFGRVHDTILFYTRSRQATWNAPKIAQNEANVRGHDLLREGGTTYRVSDLSGGGPGPAREFGERGEIAPPPGRHWQYDQAGIDALLAAGRIEFTRTGQPRLKTPLSDLPGVAVTDTWIDLEPINAAAAERLGYPTQKPEALLERIIEASSNEGDVVLDPFCGCGTSVAVAHRLGRAWIGIDITHLAVGLIRRRLMDAFGESVGERFEVIGEPTDLEGARELAKSDPYQFQFWILGKIGARPAEQKKGADRGIDGRIYFHEALGGSATRQVVLSVKAGKLHAPYVRDLRGVMEREGAELGVLLCMEDPTAKMRAEAASAGFYKSANGESYPRLQIITVADLLEGRRIDYPGRGGGTTYRQAPKAKLRVDQPTLMSSTAAEDAAPYAPRSQE